MNTSSAGGAGQRAATPDAPFDRAEARKFTDTRILPRVGDYDRAGAVPADLLDAITEAGWWAPFLPREAGGSAMSFTALGQLHEEIGRGCSSLRSLLTVHSMVAHAVHRWGSDEQRQRWLEGLASGRTPGAFCLTEPGAGSDTDNLTTTARTTGDGWLLNGTKTWITGGQRAALFLVFARAGEQVAAFLVPRDAPGVTVTPVSDMLGTRASMVATVHLDQVALGPHGLLGPAGFTSGMVLTGVLDIGRLSVACGSVGILRACLDANAQYTARRQVRGGVLRDQQLTRAKMADLVTDTTAAQLLCAEAARLKDTGDAATIMATMQAKYFASTAAARHASAAVQLHGGYGCGPDSPVSRLYRDAKVMEIIEGSSEIQQLTIADLAYRTASPS